jgi:hypothetical protein
MMPTDLDAPIPAGTIALLTLALALFLGVVFVVLNP